MSFPSSLLPATLDPGWVSLVSSFVAIGAAVIAYRAATSNVRFQQTQAQEAATLRRHNLYLKAEHMAYSIVEVSPIRLLSAQLTFSIIEDGESKPGDIPRKAFPTGRPAELAEIWDNLSEFSPQEIHEIRRITRNFDAADAYLRGVEMVPDDNRSPLVGHYTEIVEAAVVLRTLMAAVTEGFCREVEGRDEVIYGPPDDLEFIDRNVFRRVLTWGRRLVGRKGTVHNARESG